MLPVSKTGEKFTLSDGKGRYLTIGRGREDLPILYLGRAATIWHVEDNSRVCTKELCWDIWDADEPRPVLYRPNASKNQRWKIGHRRNELIFYSEAAGAGRGLDYDGDNVFISRYPRPLIAEPIAEQAPSKATKSAPKYAQTGSVDPLKQQVDFVVENARRLRSVYFKGYEFPAWTIQALADHFYALATKARVYFSDGSLTDAKQLLLQREPVNIAMKRYYDQQRMKELFGWSRGYYEEFFERHGELAPNLAVYCPTLVKMDDGSMVRIHLINSIGYAFDSKNQPDYQVLRGSPALLRQRYVRVFEKIFRCAKDVGLDTIVMSLVGAGVFANLWPDFFHSIWSPAFEYVRKQHHGVKILLMAPPGTPGPGKNIGLFPRNIREVDVDRTLFVNAWDPASIAGNGNAMDNSLDGFVGRHSMVAVLTWPLTNPHLKTFKHIVSNGIIAIDGIVITPQLTTQLQNEHSIIQTGKVNVSSSGFVSVILPNLNEDSLFDIAKQYVKDKKLPWKIRKPHSWTDYKAGVHITLNKEMAKYHGQIVKLTLGEIVHFTTESNWVAISVTLPKNLVCLYGDCHISIGQERL